MMGHRLAAILDCRVLRTDQPSLPDVWDQNEWGLIVNPVLLLSLMILLCSASPWWPNSAYAKSRHRRVSGCTIANRGS